jgi:hypothetical protein
MWAQADEYEARQIDLGISDALTTDLPLGAKSLAQRRKQFRKTAL